MPLTMLEEPHLEDFGCNLIHPWSVKLSLIKRLYHGLLEVVGGNTLSFVEVLILRCHIFFKKKIIVLII